VGCGEGSGCTPEGLQRVMHGDHIGTLFHKDAHLWVDMKETGARDMAVSARDASRHLQVCLYYLFILAILFFNPFYLPVSGTKNLLCGTAAHLLEEQIRFESDEKTHLRKK
jgi:hypothetical protein